MPAEPSRKSSGSAVNTGGTRKGRTSATPCAECKRLKMRCNKQVPCDSCVRRGCDKICPDGTIATGDGHRTFWATNGEIRIKLTELADRIQELENALQLFDQSHPILTVDRRKLKDPYISGSARAVSPNPPSSGSSSTFPAQGDNTSLEPPTLAHVPCSPISMLTKQDSKAFNENDLLVFRKALPSSSYATTLRHLYEDNLSWRYCPIANEELKVDVFGMWYDDNSSSSNVDVTPISLRMYRLATLFIVLALGGLFVTPEDPPGTEEEWDYYQLAMSLINQSSLLEAPTTEALQALCLISVYWSIRKPSAQTVNLLWVLNGTIIKLAESMGLHHDPAPVNLCPKELLRRRTIMSEVCAHDSLWAACLSRPPSMFAVTFPQAVILPSTGSHDNAYFVWKSTFLVECVTKVASQPFGTLEPSAVAQLDRSIREHSLPIILRLDGTQHDKTGNPRIQQQRWAAHLLKHRILVVLHHDNFLRAIKDMSQSPLLCMFSQSVMAAYDSSLELISTVRHLHALRPDAISKPWNVCRALLGASSVISSLVVRCPEVTSAIIGVQTLTTALEMVVSVQELYGSEPVTMLHQLRQQAQASLDTMNAEVAAALGPISQQADFSHMPLVPFVPIQESRLLNQSGFMGDQGPRNVAMFDASGMHGAQDIHQHSNQQTQTWAIPSHPEWAYNHEY